MTSLNEIDKILRSQGFAGSTNIPKIVLLAATTRLFPDPVSLAVFGPSGVGKSYAVKAGLQFIPTSEIESISGMSEKALPYLGSEMSLKNRVLFLGEAAGMADGNGRAFLRQLMTEGKIEYMTVQKTSGGLKGEKLPVVEGPICFMMTTTATRVHHEDQSRLLILNIDYDRDTIRTALLNAANGKTRSAVQIDLTPWHELQETLKANPVEVRIPYAERLAEHMPIENIKVQRDFPKVLSMIKACALVHKNDREKDLEGNIIANIEDYDVIYNLLSAPLSQGLEADATPGVRAVVEGIGLFSKNDRNSYFEGISQSRLAEHLNLDRSSVLRNVHAAIDLGYLVNLNPGKGREAKIQLGERKLSLTEALPRPQVLFEGISPEQVHRCTTSEKDPKPIQEPTPWGNEEEWFPANVEPMAPKQGSPW